MAGSKELGPCLHRPTRDAIQNQNELLLCLPAKLSERQQEPRHSSDSHFDRRNGDNNSRLMEMLMGMNWLQVIFVRRLVDLGDEIDNREESEFLSV